MSGLRKQEMRCGRMVMMMTKCHSRGGRGSKGRLLEVGKSMVSSFSLRLAVYIDRTFLYRYIGGRCCYIPRGRTQTNSNSNKTTYSILKKVLKSYVRSLSLSLPLFIYLGSLFIFMRAPNPFTHKHIYMHIAYIQPCIIFRNTCKPVILYL